MLLTQQAVNSLQVLREQLYISNCVLNMGKWEYVHSEIKGDGRP